MKIFLDTTMLIASHTDNLADELCGCPIRRSWNTFHQLSLIMVLLLLKKALTVESLAVTAMTAICQMTNRMKSKRTWMQPC